MVADALKRLGDGLDARRADDVAGVARHQREQRLDKLRMARVELLVAGEHGHRPLDVALDEGVERLVDERLCELRHANQLVVGHQGRRAAEREGVLADVHSLVSDALQIGHQLERRRDEAQIGGDWLAAGQDLQAQLVDLYLKGVDLHVALHRLAGERCAPLDQRSDALGHQPLDARAHQQDPIAQQR